MEFLFRVYLIMLIILLSRIQKSFPEDFGFVPKTWILPAEHNQLQNHAKELKARKKTKTFIIKPANGAQGHGSVYFILTNFK